MTFQENDCQQSFLKRKPNPALWRLSWTVTLDLAMFGIGMALAMLGPTLMDVSNQIEVDFVTAGSIFSFRASGYLIGAWACGPLLDNFSNPALVFFLALCLATSGAFAVPCVVHYPLMCVCFSFQGLAMGMLDTGGNTLMLTLWRDSEYQYGHEHAMHFFFGFGAAVAPQVVAWFVAGGDAAMHAWLATSISLCPCCAGFLFLALTAQPKNEHEGDVGASLNKIVLLTGFFLFFYVGTEVAYGGYISTFTRTRLDASQVDGAHMTSIYWAMLSVGRLVAALVTSHVNHTKYLAIHLVMAAVAIAILTFSNLCPTGSWHGVLVGTVIFGFALAPLFPGAMLLAEERLGRGMLGTEASVIVVMAALGESICPGVVGLAMAQETIYFGWALLIACTFCGLFFIAVLKT